MAELPGGPINTGEYERSTPDGSPLPNGYYKGMPVKVSQKETNGKNGAGIMVEVEFDITWPEEYSNRKFWDRFNVVNSNRQTVQIAKEALADLGLACGHPVLSDDDQLLGREVLMQLYIEKGKPYTDKHGQQKEGKDQNRCRKYWSPDTTIEQAKATGKDKKAAPVPAARPVAAAGGPKKWGAPKAATPVAAPAFIANEVAAAEAASQQSAAQPQATAGAQVAPWKRNKQ